MTFLWILLALLALDLAAVVILTLVAGRMRRSLQECSSSAAEATEDLSAASVQDQRVGPAAVGKTHHIGKRPSQQGQLRQGRRLRRAGHPGRGGRRHGRPLRRRAGEPAGGHGDALPVLPAPDAPAGRCAAQNGALCQRKRQPDAGSRRHLQEWLHPPGCAGHRHSVSVDCRGRQPHLPLPGRLYAPAQPGAHPAPGLDAGNSQRHAQLCRIRARSQQRQAHQLHRHGQAPRGGSQPAQHRHCPGRPHFAHDRRRVQRPAGSGDGGAYFQESPMCSRPPMPWSRRCSRPMCPDRTTLRP